MSEVEIVVADPPGRCPHARGQERDAFLTAAPHQEELVAVGVAYRARASQRHLAAAGIVQYSPECGLRVLNELVSAVARGLMIASELSRLGEG